MVKVTDLPDTITLTIQDDIASKALSSSYTRCLLALHIKNALGIPMHSAAVSLGGHNHLADVCLHCFEIPTATYRLHQDARDAANRFDMTGEWTAGEEVHLTKETSQHDTTAQNQPNKAS